MTVSARMLPTAGTRRLLSAAITARSAAFSASLPSDRESAVFTSAAKHTAPWSCTRNFWSFKLVGPMAAGLKMSPALVEQDPRLFDATCAAATITYAAATWTNAVSTSRRLFCNEPRPCDELARDFRHGLGGYLRGAGPHRQWKSLLTQPSIFVGAGLVRFTAGATTDDKAATLMQRRQGFHVGKGGKTAPYGAVCTTPGCAGLHYY